MKNTLNNPIIQYLDGFGDNDFFDEYEDEPIHRIDDLTGKIHVYTPPYKHDSFFEKPFTDVLNRQVWASLTIMIEPQSINGQGLSSETIYDHLNSTFKNFDHKYIKAVEWGVSENLHKFFLTTSELGWDSRTVHDQIVQDIIEHLRNNQPLEVVCTFNHK